MTNRTIKLNTPWGHRFLQDQISPNLQGFTFEIDNGCGRCDYWIVWGDLPADHDKISVMCDPERVIYMTDEAYVEKKFNQKFLDQFAAVISLRDDVSHRKLIKSHEINTWHLEKTFTAVYNRTPVIKSKMLSVVCSDLTDIPGHKKRFALVNKLIGHFKDRLDVYGRGFNPIQDKWHALAPYKYSIAIENSAIPGYFTEKLAECYLAHTYPIYYGAPDITAYFAPRSMLILDIDDYKKSIQSIEQLLAEDPYDQQEQLLIDQKLLYLDKYQLYSALSDVIINHFNNTGISKPRRISLKSHRTFAKHYRIRQLLNQLRTLKR